MIEIDKAYGWPKFALALQLAGVSFLCTMVIGAGIFLGLYLFTISWFYFRPF